MQNITVDIAIIGGGIAGLWLQKELQQKGFSTALCDTQSFAGKQTLCSQGIIHGGTKYSLHGALSSETKAIANMPQRWFEALKGQGHIDLSATKLLSQHHYLWSLNTVGSKVTTFFASKALESLAQSLSTQDYPDIFKTAKFKGKVYRLNEFVIDVPSLVNNLTGESLGQNSSQPVAPTRLQLTSCRHLSFEAVQSQNKIKHQLTLTLQDNQELKVNAQKFILTAGEGNAELLSQLQVGRDLEMQKRPLHMVMLKSHKLPPIYGHCIGAKSKPLVTVTTHYHKDGSSIWYLGGHLAETGVDLPAVQQIDTAKALLQQCLPWIKLEENHVAWRTLRINRAEPVAKNAQGETVKPDSAYVKPWKNDILVCWPTKLTLTPQLADQVLAHIATENLQAQTTDESNQKVLDKLKLFRSKTSQPPWDYAFDQEPLELNI